MKTAKTALSILLSLCFLFSLLPLAFAQTPAFNDKYAAAEYIREQMKSRSVSISFLLQFPESEADESNGSVSDHLMTQIFDEVFAHTGIGDEGDYLSKHVSGYSVSSEALVSSVPSKAQAAVTVSVEYYTTAAEEAALSAAVASALKELDTDDRTDEEKITAIAEFIRGHVAYDHAHQNDDGYTLKYSAYAALVKGTAVCQGYASLFYRMALDAGLDARILTGDGYDGERMVPHAWNIVRLDGSYYYVDTTWYCTEPSGKYLLAGKDTFGRDHFVDDDAKIEAAYDISESGYRGKENRRIVNAADAERRYVVFGTYPQSRVEDSSLLAALNAEIKNISWEKDWTSYGYYCGEDRYGSETRVEEIRFLDRAYRGEKYRAVMFKIYRPFGTVWESSDVNSYQDNNGFSVNTVYWFRFDPIVWRVLDRDSGLLLSELILDARAFSDRCIENDGSYTSDNVHKCNEYEYSSLRNWLLTDFTDTAFSAGEKNKLSDVTAGSADRVTLLSSEDVTREAFGFLPSVLSPDPAKMSFGTAYAQCQGLFVYPQTGRASWWLNSPEHNSFASAAISFSGNLKNDSENTYDTSYGVRPVIRIAGLTDAQDYKGAISADYRVNDIEETAPADDFQESLYDKDSWIHFASSAFPAGEGTEESPYLISGAQDLALLAKAVNAGIPHYQRAVYLQTADIDLSGHSWVPIGNETLCEGFFEEVKTAHSFLGTYYGNGYTISGMNIDRAYGDYLYYGLFGMSYGHIDNIRLKDARIEISYDGFSRDTSVIDSFRGTGMCLGGIAGRISYENNTYTDRYFLMPSITNCIADGIRIRANTYISIQCGGIAGKTNSGTVTNCAATGDISVNSTKSWVSVGGIVGMAVFGNAIDNCCFSGNISAQNGGQEKNGFVFRISSGGICGEMSSSNGRLCNCRAAGTIDNHGTAYNVSGYLIGDIGLSDVAEICNNLTEVKLAGTEVLFASNLFGTNPYFSFHDCRAAVYNNIILSETDGLFAVAYSGDSEERRELTGFDNYSELFADELGFDRKIWRVSAEELPTLKIESRAGCAHDYLKTEETSAACTHVGETVCICRNCGQTQKTVTGKNRHIWDAGRITETASRTAPGTKTCSCTVCKGTKSEIIPKLSRARENATLIPGDVDLDGGVTAWDARLALRAAVGLENYAEGSLEFRAADADSDGKIDAADARRILRAAVHLEDL